jgi:arylsulfatase A-like enzyme/Tfp pilus assembly protein PilF
MSKHKRRALRSTAAPAPAAGTAGRGQRHWIIWAAAAGVAVLAAGMVAVRVLRSGPEPAFERRLDQNVLLVTLDTVRADAVGAYGGRARTPNLDRLAALGLRFDAAHAHAVTTLPSHASILTGLNPPEHGIHDNNGYRLAPAIPTLASRLKAQGFATGAFVAAFPLDSRFGLTTGFDLYDDHYPGTSGGREFILPERRGDAVVAAARAWIGAQRGRWFAWVHLFDPHAPYTPPPPFDREYADSPYHGEVAYTDSVIGTLLASLPSSAGRPTIVVATGDHGEALGDHGEMTHGLFAYESTLRIPLIVAQLGGDRPAWTTASAQAPAAPPHVVADPVRHIDIVPTVLDVLQLPAAADLPGASLIQPPRAPPDAGRVSYFEALTASLNRGWAPLRGVVVGRDKYIDLPLPELYDLGADPGERDNLAGRSAARRTALEQALDRFARGAADSRQVRDPEATERLRALGYVTGSASPKASYTEADDPKRLVELDQAIHLAVDLYQRGRARDAMPIYEGILAAHPKMEVAYAHLAMLQWDIGDPSAAVSTLRRALAAGIDSQAIRTKLGIYLAESGNVAEAVPLLRASVSGEFPDLDALNALGISLARSARTDEAVATFRRILEFSPSDAMALENLGSIALERGALTEARDYFTRALASDPASAQAHNGLGVVAMKSGDRRAAIDHWQRSVARDPSNFYALYNVAVALVDEKQPAAARPYLERFAQTAPPAFYAADIRRVRAMLARMDREGGR